MKKKKLYFFFNDTANTEIYTYLHTLTLHDALPIFLPFVLNDRICDDAGANAKDGRSLARRCFRRQSKGSDRNIESRAPASPAPVFMPGTGFREFSGGTAIRASGPVLHLVNDFHGAALGKIGRAKV